MALQTASLIVWLASLWLYAGAAVAALFLLVGIDRIDEDARGTYSFRPLLIPGILLLWPLVLRRWWVLEIRQRLMADFLPSAAHRPWQGLACPRDPYSADLCRLAGRAAILAGSRWRPPNRSPPAMTLQSSRSANER